jgi:hypothetical protein
MQLLRKEPALKGRRFITLLPFETEDDLAFVSAHPAAAMSARRAHTGKSCADIGSTARINISSILFGKPFPNDWTVLGAYLWSDRPTTASIRCISGGKETRNEINLPGGKWMPAFVDLTQLNASSSTTVPSDASFEISAAQPVLCDDVMLLDNTKEFIGTDESAWTIRQRGFKITIERDKWFVMTLDTIDGAADGWNCDDFSSMRATFSSQGKTRRLTIYSDGRSFWDGRYEPLSGKAKSDPTLEPSHTNPGKITVADASMGRVNRNSDGDANNDGYNETLGAYQVIAKGPRMEMTLAPASAELVRPLIEISDLPAGKPLVTLEGRLIESLTRLKNGNVLIEVPARIERPTTLNVRIE